MIAIIDYGVGNLFSLKSSFAIIGAEAVVTNDINEIEKADRIILPGVGAFEDAINKLKEQKLDLVLEDQVTKGKPLMGICLGMQLLFDKSYEYGEHEGLSFIKGKIIPMAGIIPNDLKIPHMGWNALQFKNGKHDIFRYINEYDHVYFVHSYFASDCDENTIAVSDYGYPLTAAVAKDNVIGCQFHPEKSGEVGMKILRAFCELGG